MNFFQFIDVPSMMMSIGGALGIGCIVGYGQLRRILQVTRDVALPVGVNGTLIGFTMMLANLEDPSVFGPALSVALLTTFYGVIVYTVADSLIGITDNIDEEVPVRAPS